jgi:DNA polymerase I-like protein with 3'-5' exonuclease and polymerase domains
LEEEIVGREGFKIIIEADARQLEWRVAVWLSQDKVGMEEIRNGVDAHSDNQKRFKLPSRLIAKTYLFRLIYGGSAYSYANDPNFTEASSSEKFWQGVIDETYAKYYGLARWHKSLMHEATTTGRVVIPTGRIYEFEPKMKRGSMEWPRTDILNYPVQGMAAELVAIARVAAYNRYQNTSWKEKVKFINTVHDSIILDADVDEGSELMYNICIWLEKVYEDINGNFYRMFKKELNVEMAGEIKYGPTWGDLKEFKREEWK